MLDRDQDGYAGPVVPANEIEDMKRRIAHLERLVLSRIDNGCLLPALRRAFGDRVFTTSEAWTLAKEQRATADMHGLPAPELPEALDIEGITTSHGLGRWLADREGFGIVRIGREAVGVVWGLAS